MEQSSIQGSAYEAMLDSSEIIDNNEGLFGRPKIVKFHLHTTGFREFRAICQISASYDGKPITQYILPDKDIEPDATDISGFRTIEINGERKLYRDGIKMESLAPQEGLETFLELLGDTFGHNIVLAAHNLQTYHGHVIIHELQKHNLIDNFKLIVRGFVDTLPVFRSFLKERKKENKGYSLEELAADYNIPLDIEPVQVLDSLITESGCTDEFIMQHAKSLTRFIQCMPENVEARIVDLNPIKSAVSKTMLEKIARAGISMDMLRSVYVGSGENGVGMLLQEVTKSPKIIKSIVDKLSQEQ